MKPDKCIFASLALAIAVAAQAAHAAPPDQPSRHTAADVEAALLSASPIPINPSDLQFGTISTCAPSSAVTYSLTPTEYAYTISLTGKNEAHSQGFSVHNTDAWVPTLNVDVFANGQYLTYITGESASFDLVIPLNTSTLSFVVSKNSCDPNPAMYVLNVSPTEQKLSVLSGTITDIASAPVPGAVVSAYDQDMHWVGAATTAANGKYSVSLPRGIYYAHASKDKVDVWLPGAPLQSASAIDVRAASATKNLVLSPQRPTIVGVTGFVAPGLVIKIDGSNFGKTMGYVDFGGTVTHSSTAITSWSDGIISVVAPSGARAGCLRVFSTVGGWSDCIMSTAANLPSLAITANKTTVVEGNAITYTLALNGVSQYDANVNISFSGTAKPCPQTTGVCDYNKPTLPVIIPAGQKTATFSITPIVDNVTELTETLTVGISTTGTGYVVGSTNKSVTTKVTDN